MDTLFWGFGQFISVTWLNLLRRLGFGQTPPPPVDVGTPAQIWVFFLNEPSLRFWYFGGLFIVGIWTFW